MNFLPTSGGIVGSVNQRMPGELARERAPVGEAPRLSEETMNQLSLNIHNREYSTNVGRGPWEQIGRYVGGTLLDTADSVYASPLNPVGWVSDSNERGSLWEMAPAEQRLYYEDNKGLIEGSSAIVGGIGAAITAEALLIPRVATALASSTAITGTRLWKFGKEWGPAARRAMLETQRNAILTGKNLKGLDKYGGKEMLAYKTATVAGKMTRTLPFDYAVMWNNEAFNSGDLATEAFWVALGGGIGAGAGAIAARGLARRSMNSQWARSEISTQNGNAGATNALTRAPQIDETFSPMQPGNRAGARQESYIHTKDSSELTTFLVGARANTPGGMDAANDVQSRAHDVRASYLAAAEDSTKQILAKGMRGVSGVVRAPMATLPEVKYMLHTAAADDPLLAEGLDELALVDSLPSKAIKERDAFIKRTYENANKQEPSPESIADAKLAARMKRQQVLSFVNGTWFDPESPVVEAAHLFNPKQVRANTKLNDTGATVVAPSNRDRTIKIEQDLVPRGRDGVVDVANLPHEDRFALYQATDDLIRHRGRATAPLVTTVVESKASSWFALDALDDLAELHPNLVRFSDDNAHIRDIDSLKRHSLRLKANEILQKVGPTGEITEELRLQYNLPTPTPMELLEDPAGDIMRVWLKEAAKPGGTAKELGDALARGKPMHGLDLLPTDNSMAPSIKGLGSQFNRGEKGKHGQPGTWLRPLMATFESRDTLSRLAKAGHEEHLARVKAEQVSVLSDQNRSAHVGQNTAELVQNPALARAHSVNELHSGQNTGIGSRVGQALSEFLPSKFKSRDNPTILAVHNLHEQASRQGTRNYVDALGQTNIQEVLSKYGSRAGIGLRAELDQFVSLRPGWDIKDVVDMGDGRVGFELDNTPTNEMLMGAPIEEGDVLTNFSTGKAVTLSEEAATAMQGYWNRISGELRKGTNSIREANNRVGIGEKSFYVPSRDTKGKRVGFIQGPDGQIVPGVAVIESTDQAFAAESKRVLDYLGDGYIVRNKESLAATRDQWDMEAMDWMDRSASSALRGARQQGGLNSAFVRDGAFLDMLEQSKQGYAKQSQETLNTLMAHPLQVARMNSAVERRMIGAAPVGNGARGVNTPQRNIYDEYEQALTGNSASYRESALLSQMSEAVESGIDAIGSVTVRHIADTALRWGVAPGKLQSAKSYDAILDALGEHSPYADANEYLAAQGVRMPLNVRRASQSLNKLATNVVLRWDPLMAHASLNMIGLIPTILGGVKAGGAPASTAFQVKGKTVPMWDSIAIIKGGIADMTNMRRGRGGEMNNADFAMMVRNGDASQSSFEYHKWQASIKSKSDFDVALEKVDSALAWASDGSENLSRQVSHFTGLRLARYQGITDMDRAHEFAREFANASIADYAPTNRPELYQTSLGSVFGLFQSYAVNQYTKMFHWLEKGDYQAFGVQAASQAAMFGIPGTYGANAAFALHDKVFQDSGEPSLLDSLYSRFGPTLGNAMAHGGIGEITGIAMWTRGDMQPRMPIVTSGMAPPGVSVVQSLTNGITGTISPFLNNLPQDALPAAIENLQREMPNRVLKGALGVMQGNYETDRSGNVVHNNQNFLESIVRVAGFRTTRQQIDMNVYYANRTSMTRNARMRDKLRTRLRADMRSAASSGKQVDPMEYFDKYAGSGGNPTTFRSWFTGVAREATDPRSAQQLKKSLESPTNQLSLWRYGGYGAWEVE